MTLRICEQIFVRNFEKFWKINQVQILTLKKLVSGITDIEPWYFETFNEANPNVELFIKRDDNTGATLTGNKVRKLEFLLSDALENKADAIITCGMATSNHCRTTALACAKLGLECHLVSNTLNFRRWFSKPPNFSILRIFQCSEILILRINDTSISSIARNVLFNNFLISYFSSWQVLTPISISIPVTFVLLLVPVPKCTRLDTMALTKKWTVLPLSSDQRAKHHILSHEVAPMRHLSGVISTPGEKWKNKNSLMKLQILLYAQDQVELVLTLPWPTIGLVPKRRFTVSGKYRGR